MLPKDVLGIIAKLIHRSYIDKLNEEYHKIFSYRKVGEHAAYLEALWGRFSGYGMIPVYNYRYSSRKTIILRIYKVTPTLIQMKKISQPLHYFP